MTKGGRRTALRTRITASKPSDAQYQAESGRGGAPTGKTNRPPGRSTEWTSANRPGSSSGRKWPNAPKLTTRSKAGPKRGRGRVRTHPGDAGRSVGAHLLPPDGQHPRTEVDARHAPAADPAQHIHAGAVPQQRSSPCSKGPRASSSPRPRRARSRACGTGFGRTWARAGRSRARPRTAPERPARARVGPCGENIMVSLGAAGDGRVPFPGSLPREEPGPGRPPPGRARRIVPDQGGRAPPDPRPLP